MPLVLEGKQLHNQILKLGFGSEIIIQTSLVNMYGFFGELECMQQVFDETPQRDLVMWNSVVAAYSQHNFPYMALAVASAMAREGLRLNGSSVVSLLSACSFLKAIRKGKEVHGYVIRGQLVDNHDVFVYNALISMYSRCGVLSSARRIFQTMPMKNVVSWTSMINCYSDNDHLKEAFWLFDQMESEKIKPDEITILGVISMSSKFRSFKIAEWIDRYVERNGFRSTGSIAMLNALMDMHAKCGNIKKACEIFDGMEQKSLMSWTTIIHGLAMHSDGKQALAMFSQMQREGCKPDGVVFLNILSACSHAGMVDEARNCFNSMVNDYHMKPRMEHYGCMVDLLCRAGLVSEAFEFVQTMPDKPDTMIWRMLLGACQGQGDGSLARRIMNQLREIGPKNSRDYGLLSNLYAAMDEWDNVKEIRREMKEKGVIKEDPGSSSIENILLFCNGGKAGEFTLANLCQATESLPAVKYGRKAVNLPMTVPDKTRVLDRYVCSIFKASVPYQVQPSMIQVISTRAREIASHPENMNRKTIRMVVHLTIGDYMLQFVRTKSISIEELERVKIEGCGKQCVICLEEMQCGSEAIRMPCSHEYHESCIVKWLKMSLLCPLCRFEMSANPHDKLFVASF
ncbi:hypothetical protein C1H46_022411 [Malus baccata]|uniref:RING-type domain-containing protein n=1 Tax=Malus baccata TaxID=106549 RepID=A0A540LZU0_MALBA|nr:hypothetical protein C1H46_022411 [Malus baccata]